jgi:hypothetical protein
MQNAEMYPYYGTGNNRNKPVNGNNCHGPGSGRRDFTAHFRYTERRPIGILGNETRNSNSGQEHSAKAKSKAG